MSAPTIPLFATPSRPGLCSPCGAKPDWSPGRDPRFSRRTPDGLLARIAASKSSVSVVGGSDMWASNVMHGIARSTPLFSAKRGKAVAALKKIAERLEAGTSGVVQTSSSPSLAVVVRERGHESQKTMKVRARHRAVGSWLMGEGP